MKLALPLLVSFSAFAQAQNDGRGLAVGDFPEPGTYRGTITVARFTVDAPIIESKKIIRVSATVDADHTVLVLSADAEDSHAGRLSVIGSIARDSNGRCVLQTNGPSSPLQPSTKTVFGFWFDFGYTIEDYNGASAKVYTQTFYRLVRTGQLKLR